MIESFLALQYMLKVMWCGRDERLGSLEIVTACFSTYQFFYVPADKKNTKGGHSANSIESLDFYGCFSVMCMYCTSCFTVFTWEIQEINHTQE